MWGGGVGGWLEGSGCFRVLSPPPPPPPPPPHRTVLLTQVPTRHRSIVQSAVVPGLTRFPNIGTSFPFSGRQVWLLKVALATRHLEFSDSPAMSRARSISFQSIVLVVLVAALVCIC